MDNVNQVISFGQRFEECLREVYGTDNQYELAEKMNTSQGTINRMLRAETFGGRVFKTRILPLAQYGINPLYMIHADAPKYLSTAKKELKKNPFPEEKGLRKLNIELLRIHALIPEGI